MNKMIAYCGLDCEKCDAHIATVNNDDALREKTAKLWAEINHAPITADMINCMGCRTEGVKTPFCDSMCGIRKCALEKGLETCGSCPDLDRCRTVKMVLDNSDDARANLEHLV